MTTSRRRAALATLAGSTASILIVSVQAVVLVPFYLHAIGPRLYGAWLGSGDILVWMQAFDLGLPNLMIQRIGAAYGRQDLRGAAECFAAGMAALALVALVVVAGGLAISHPLPRWMGLVGAESGTLQACFVVGTIATALNIFGNGIVGFSRGIQRTTFMNGVTVASGLVGFGVSLGLVLTGWGLWAVALGLVARSGISLIGSIVFAAVCLRGDLYHFFRVRRAVLREFLAISPATALGGIGYAVMNQSEVALTAILLSPELAVVLGLTRKALDMARGLVDAIAFSTYGGFAHLVTSDQRHRALHVHAEIHSLRLSLAIAMASAYMAVNGSLLSVWVGSTQYGGALLTILMAVQFIVVGSSFLMNYLYRATGQVMRGSLALFLEGVTRVPLMIGLLLWVGLPGIPIAGIITSGVFGWLAYRWMRREVQSFSDPPPSLSLRAAAGQVAILGIGALACILVRWETWIYVLIAGSAIAIGGEIALIHLDPSLRDVRASLGAGLSRLRAASIHQRG